MAHDFGRAAHAHPASAIAFFEQTVDPFTGAAFLEALGLGRGELLVQDAQRPEFDREHREKLALHMVENRREVSHERQTRRTPFHSNKSKIIPNKLASRKNLYRMAHF